MHRTSKSSSVAERRTVWRVGSSETGCSRVVMYAAAVPVRAECARRHNLYYIRDSVCNQCSSINASRAESELTAEGCTQVALQSWWLIVTALWLCVVAQLGEHYSNQDEIVWVRRRGWLWRHVQGDNESVADVATYKNKPALSLKCVSTYWVQCLSMLRGGGYCRHAGCCHCRCLSATVFPKRMLSQSAWFQFSRHLTEVVMNHTSH